MSDNGDLTPSDVEELRQTIAQGIDSDPFTEKWEHEGAHAALRTLCDHVARLTAALDAARDKAERYDRINTPELYEFVAAVENEALHQRERWPSDHDAGKADADWFWLIGYLAGKALHNPPKPDMGEIDAKLHRIITVAAAAANWHAAVLGTHTAMRPGIDLKAAARTQPETTND